MAGEDLVPQSVEDVKKLPGVREATEDEFKEFMKNFSSEPSIKKLVDCTQPESEGKLCFKSGCYKNQRVVVYCRNGRCQHRFFYSC